MSQIPHDLTSQKHLHMETNNLPEITHYPHVCQTPNDLTLDKQNKGWFILCPNFERPSVWTNENSEMSKVQPLGLYTKGKSSNDIAPKEV